MLTDPQLATTCIADEAANQPHEGRVAVGIVILNRMGAKYESDGTVAGTVLKHFQFSGFWFAMLDGRYRQTEFDPAGAAAQAQRLYDGFSVGAAWPDCETAWADAQAWWAAKPMSFTPGPAFRGITKRTMLYLNPAIVHPLPDWATPANQDAVIFAHTFFHPA